jgi:hypothetical protein
VYDGGVKEIIPYFKCQFWGRDKIKNKSNIN